MPELERDLTALARELGHPPTPDLAGAVGARLRAAPPRQPLRTRRIVIALALALLVPTATAAAVPPVRDAVLEALGIKGVTIKRVPERLPSSPGAKLDLGSRVAPQRAAGLVSFEPQLPRLAAELGEPDEVYHRTAPAGGSLSFVYGARAGIPRSRFTQRALVLTEFRGGQSNLYAGKVAGVGTTVEPVVVNGERGVWMAGEPHQFLYTDERGQVLSETLRLAGDTLLWQRGPLTLRLEGVVSKAAALRIARSVR